MTQTVDTALPTFSAFAGCDLVASGPLEPMLRATKRRLEAGAMDRLLIFEDATGKQVDFNLQGTADEVVARATANTQTAGARGPGRPKLGVVSREISLLPRHWEWLEGQPNGASAALRRLIDEARKVDPERGQARRALDAASRFLTAIAGDLPGYEEALRALYARDRVKFEAESTAWPADIRSHVERLANAAVRE